MNLRKKRSSATFVFEAKYRGPDGIGRIGSLSLYLVDEIEAQLDEEKLKVLEKEEELLEQALVLSALDSVLQAQYAELDNQKIKLEQGNQELEEQQKQIDEQKSVLKMQLDEINNQRILLGVSILVLAIIAILLFFAIRNYRKKQEANKILAEQKELIEEKHKEITDSIVYAERIQRSFLATQTTLDQNLNEYLLIFKPKEAVSGDFLLGRKAR